mgnify:CR=1 FL=1|tara:strand:- start:190461 stop:192143 length:1683 start_codon:yes stop_codon:yes gene_type:complete
MLAGILISPLSNKVGMPVLLVFLCIGMLAGEDGPGNIAFSDFNLAFIVSSLALAIILLDGGMRTPIASFRVGLRPALLLSTFGVVITALICGLFAAWILQLPILVGLLMGAIVSSTDAAAVFSLLQGKRLHINERVKATLEIESGSNDPMAIFLTMVLILYLQNSGETNREMMLMLAQQFGIGTITGIGCGYLVTTLLRKLSLVSAMYPLLVVSAGVSMFGFTNYLGGSGFLAIYLMGVYLAGQDDYHMDNILQIHDGLSWLAQLILFLILGLLVTPSELMVNIISSLVIAFVLILVARPVATIISLLPFGFSRNERIFISWAGLRGAVPVVLAIFPLMAGLPDANQIFEVTFVVVLVSLILQGSTLNLLARVLKLEVPAKPEPKLRFHLNEADIEGYDLLLFPLKGARWITPMNIMDLQLPPPSRIVMFFRDNQIIERRAGVMVQENDLLIVMARHEHINDISQILGWDEPPERLTDHRFFGEFTVHGEVTLNEIKAIYSVKLEQCDPNQTLSEYFTSVSKGHPVIGDRIDMGTILLVVREIDGDKVTRVGLKLRKEIT